MSPSQYRDGHHARAKSRHSRQCSHLHEDDRQCGAWALRGGDKCAYHSMTQAEQAAFRAKGNRKRVEKSRERAGLRDAGRNRQYADEPTLMQALREIRRLLDAKLPWGEPDLQSRAYGALAVAALFRLDRETKGRLLDLLREAAPRAVEDAADASRLLDLDRARADLLQAVREGAIDPGVLPPDLRGLADVFALDEEGDLVLA